MKFTNQKIYQVANELASNFSEIKTYIPAKANFFIQKNIAAIINAAQEIDKSRLEILQHYGVLNDNTQQYDIPKEKLQEATKEIEDLFTIEQDLDIKTFSIDCLGNTEFTSAEMQAILFMIEE